MNAVIKILQLIVICIFYKEFFKYKRNWIWVLPYWLGNEVIAYIIGIYMPSPWINMLYYFAYVFLFAELFYEAGWKRKLTFSMIFFIIAVSMEVVVVLIFDMLHLSGIKDLSFYQEGALYYELIIVILLQLIIIRVIHLFNRHGIGDGISLTEWGSIFCLPVLCLVAVIVIWIEIVHMQGYKIYHFILLLIVVTVNILSYYFYCMIEEKNRVKMENGIYQTQTNMYKGWYERVVMDETESASFRHDVKNHMEVIGRLCERGLENGQSDECLEEIRKYMEKIRGNVADRYRYVKTGNLIVDSILDTKIFRAKSKDIETDITVDIPEKTNIDDMDMVILLGNLMDNAIEACDRVSDIKRKISLFMKYSGGTLILNLKNTYDGSLDGKSGEELTIGSIETKKEEKRLHGIGLKNVKRVIDSHNGECTIAAADRTFEMRILLYNISNLQNITK